VPGWLAALVIGRDLILAAGGLLFAYVFPGIHDPDTWKPTRIGKYATFYTVITIGLALVRAITESEALRPFVGAFGIMSALLTTISGLQYVVAGIRGFVEDRRTKAQGGSAA
jgi:phosphatidylglycerophosphate synthase